MVKDFKNTLSELHPEKLLDNQFEDYQGLSNEIRSRYFKALKSILTLKDIIAVNKTFEEYIEWCNQNIDFVRRLLNPVHKKSYLKYIELELIQHRSRINLIYIKNNAVGILKSRLDMFSIPTIIIGEELNIERNAPHFDHETGKELFSDANISKNLVTRFNYHEVEVERKYHLERDINQEYTEFLFHRYEYLKLYILSVFENPEYSEAKKRTDYSYIIFLLRIVCAKLDNIKASNVTDINNRDGGLPLSTVEYDIIHDDNKEQLDKIISAITSDLRAYCHSSITSEISMLEQLREYLVINQDILLNSKSSSKPKVSFQIKPGIDPSAYSKVRDSLLKDGFINEKTTLDQFKSIFNRRKIHKRVIWDHNPTSLKYFINYLYDNDIIVEKSNNQKWQITSRCFLLAIDGDIYPSDDFKGLGKSGKKVQKQITEAVKAFLKTP